MEIIKAELIHGEQIGDIEQKYIECPWSREQIFDAINGENYEYFVAIDGKERNEVVGYAGIEWCLDEGNICNIAVKSEYRRRGVATALINEIISGAKVKGVKTLYLEVNEFNESAIKVYEKLGFTTYNLRKNYYRGASAICMKKEI